MEVRKYWCTKCKSDVFEDIPGWLACYCYGTLKDKPEEYSVYWKDYQEDNDEAKFQENARR